jgi:hypothetical protein
MYVIGQLGDLKPLNDDIVCITRTKCVTKSWAKSCRIHARNASTGRQTNGTFVAHRAVVKWPTLRYRFVLCMNTRHGQLTDSVKAI